MAKVAAFIALSLAAPAVTAPAFAADDPPAPRQIELTRLVIQDCGSCHGLKRTGGLGSAITAEALTGRTVAGLQTIILDGVPGTAMPPWRPLLTEGEAAWIAAYLLKDGP